MTVPGVRSFSSGLMTSDEEDPGQSFTRAYPIPSGTASTMLCSCPSGGKQSSRRRAVIWGRIFHALARQKECQISEGHLMPDHVPRCIAIPPKHPVSWVIGFLKGKSAIAIARLSGKELEQVRPYIREQESADGIDGQF